MTCKGLDRQQSVSSLSRVFAFSLRYGVLSRICEMSIEITFEEDGGSGLVAAGCSLWQAAKRLGVSMKADCRGQGECDGCVVKILHGAELVSPPGESEYKMLGGMRVADGERLACLTTLISQGAIVARIIPSSGNTSPHPGGGPLPQQLGNFIESETVKLVAAVNYVRGKSNELVEKFLNLQSNKPAASPPDEHEGTPPKN